MSHVGAKVKVRRCPKCKGAAILYSETLTLPWHFEVENGRIVHHGCGDVTEADHGPPVHATCEKGHQWALRGVRSIMDLELDDSFYTGADNGFDNPG